MQCLKSFAGQHLILKGWLEFGLILNHFCRRFLNHFCGRFFSIFYRHFFSLFFGLRLLFTAFYGFICLSSLEVPGV